MSNPEKPLSSNGEAWQAGFEAGHRGDLSAEAADGQDSWSWLQGFITGLAKKNERPWYWSFWPFHR